MLLTFAKRTQRDIWAGASGSLFKLDADWKETAPEMPGSSWQADTQTCDCSWIWVCLSQHCCYLQSKEAHRWPKTCYLLSGFISFYGHEINYNILYCYDHVC